MASASNLQIILAERPQGDIIPGTTLTQKYSPIPTESDLQDGEILIQNMYLSLDPAMRGWMSDRRSYVAPIPLGTPMGGMTISRVVASKCPNFARGDMVTAVGKWQEYAVVSAEADPFVQKLSDTPGAAAHPTDMLSVLGITGLTAWVGMSKIADVKPGDLVVVSGAAGATGSVAGQIAKIKGARVVGIAGGETKRVMLTDELGFDVGLDYKDPDFREKFDLATEGFIDVYFDNVGGEILDMALAKAKPHATFVMCGGISQYNATDVQGPKNLFFVITMRIKMQGFIVTDHIADLPRARQEIAQWLVEGKMKRKETILKGGLKVAEEGLVGIFKGINTGKLIVEIASPDTELPPL